MKLTKTIIASMIIGIMCTCGYKNACAAEAYTPTELSINQNSVVDYGYTMMDDGNGFVTIKNKIIKAAKSKKSKISLTFVSEQGNVTANVIKKKGEVVPIFWKKPKLYTYSEDNKKITISVMNKKGKVEKSYLIKPEYENISKIKEVVIHDLKIKCNKLYYLMWTCGKNNKVKNYIQTYDLKKNKVVSSKEIDESHRYIYEGNFLYRFDYGKKCFVKKYALNGKKMLESYQLPCSKEDFIINAHPWKNEATTPYNFGGTFIKGNYIYVLNKKGLYRLDTRDGDNFELEYDGSNDNIFNPAQGEELNMDCFGMFDNGNIYMIFANYDESIRKNVIYKRN